MSGHTPGPWTLTHIAGSNFAVQRYDVRGMLGDSPNVYPIFNRDLSAIDGTTICVSPENARLIAAAPDLLAALAELEAALFDGLCNSGVPDFDPERLERARIEARAAIARTSIKAGGETK